MLIDQLGMAVATKKHAEVVKPGDDALKFHAVNEEHVRGVLVLRTALRNTS